MRVVQGTAEKGNAALCTTHLSKVIAEVRVDFGFASYNIDPSSVLPEKFGRGLSRGTEPPKHVNHQEGEG